MPFYSFLGEGSPTKIDSRKKGHPYSNLSTGGPSLDVLPSFNHCCFDDVSDDGQALASADALSASV